MIYGVPRERSSMIIDKIIIILRFYDRIVGPFVACRGIHSVYFIGWVYIILGTLQKKAL